MMDSESPFLDRILWTTGCVVRNHTGTFAFGKRKGKIQQTNQKKQGCLIAKLRVDQHLTAFDPLLALFAGW